MLNRWVRYFPIMHELREAAGKGSILEVGSGSMGLGEFLPTPFTGCDIVFDPQTMSPYLTPVRVSATGLPFADESFDTVLCLDTLEHIQRHSRPAVLSEAVRVAKRVVVIGAPMGDRALKADVKLARFYERLGNPIPLWLEEHLNLKDEFPTRSEIETILAGLRKPFEVRKGESALFHLLLSVLEATPIARNITAAFSRTPWNVAIAPILHWMNRSGTYRTYFIVKK